MAKDYDIDEIYKERWEKLITWLYAQKKNENDKMWGVDSQSQIKGFMYYYVLVEMGRIEQETVKNRITTA